jgi:hypothetical protein
VSPDGHTQTCSRSLTVQHLPLLAVQRSDPCHLGCLDPLALLSGRLWGRNRAVTAAEPAILAEFGSVSLPVGNPRDC